MLKKLPISLTVIVTLMTACSPPGGKITEDSKSEECKQELASALQTYSSDLGLPFMVAPTDAETIFETGEVQKSYGLAGATINGNPRSEE